MFRNLLSRLLDPAPPAALSAQDAEVAIAALLVRIARADDHYGEVEKHRIDQVLARRRGLDAAEAAERRAAAEMIEAEAPDTVRFTRALKAATALEDRARLVQALWSVALADGLREAEEDRLMRLVANLLGLSDVENAQARQAAERAMGRE